MVCGALSLQRKWELVLSPRETEFEQAPGGARLLRTSWTRTPLCPISHKVLAVHPVFRGRHNAGSSTLRRTDVTGSHSSDNGRSFVPHHLESLLARSKGNVFGKHLTRAPLGALEITKTTLSFRN